jgi:hypothetical protein
MPFHLLRKSRYKMSQCLSNRFIVEIPKGGRCTIADNWYLGNERLSIYIRLYCDRQLFLRAQSLVTKSAVCLRCKER